MVTYMAGAEPGAALYGPHRWLRVKTWVLAPFREFAQLGGYVMLCKCSRRIEATSQP